jgi:hypothetical protein
MIDLVTDTIRVGHMLAFAIGIGAAAFLETQILRRFLTRIDAEGLTLMLYGHRLIKSAVYGLWITGVALLTIRVGLQGAPMSDKLLAKLLIVTLLTVNMRMIDRFVLPGLVAHEGASIHHVPFLTRAGFGGIAGFSAACWLSALLLGGLGITKTMEGADLARLFLPLLGMATLAGMIAGAVAGLRWRNPFRSGTA